jgi:hypothetical protein
MVTKLFIVGQKRCLNAFLTSGIKDLWISFEPFVNFHDILYGCDAIQRDLDAIALNPIASTIGLSES